MNRNLQFREMHRDSIQLAKYRRSISRIGGSIDSLDIRISQWEILMRKFSEDCKTRSRCTAFLGDLPCIPREKQTFMTGSTYEGSWNVFGMCGRGTYTFPNGTIYRGELDGGQFHGNGELIFTNGMVLKGRWERGEMINRTMVFPDGVEYEPEDWEYLKTPDRRFGYEQLGVNASNTADERPTRKIPPGYYDTGDGFFNPKTGSVVDYNNLTRVVRLIVSPAELKWVFDNCKKSENDSVGPRPDLYETWWDEDVKASQDQAGTSVRTSINSLSYNEPEISFQDTANNPWSRRKFITFDPVQEEYSVMSFNQSLRTKGGSVPSLIDKRPHISPRHKGTLE